MYILNQSICKSISIDKIPLVSLDLLQSIDLFSKSFKEGNINFNWFVDFKIKPKKAFLTDKNHKRSVSALTVLYFPHSHFHQTYVDIECDVWVCQLEC